MSLINDALKRARDEDASRDSPSAPRASREDPAPSQGKLVALALAMGGIIIILLTVIIVALLQLFKAPAPQVAAEKPLPVEKVTTPDAPDAPVAPAVNEAAAVKPADAAPQIAPAPVAAPTPPQKPAEPIATTAATQKPEPVTTPAAETPQATAKAETAATPDASLKAPESTPAEPPAAPKSDLPDTKIAEFIQNIQVRGIGPRKVLLALPGSPEPRAYVEGAPLDCPFPLTLLSLSPQQLVFTDAEGHKYNKPL